MGAPTCHVAVLGGCAASAADLLTMYMKQQQLENHYGFCQAYLLAMPRLLCEAAVGVITAAA